MSTDAPQTGRSVLAGAMAGRTSVDLPPDAAQSHKNGKVRRILQGFRRAPDAVADSVGQGGTGTARVLSRLISAALMVCVVCGPAAIAWRVMSPPQPEQGASTSTTDTLRVLSRRSVASETGAAWVSTWLASSQASAATVKALYPHLAASLQLPKTAATASDVRVVDAVASAPGVWSVTVSARVTPTSGAPVTRFYQVPVLVDGEPGSVSAHPMAQPAVVAGPVSSPAREALAYVVSVSADSTVGVAVGAGLDAMLTGRGDLARYTTPGVDLRPLATPYTSVAVLDVRADRRAVGVVDTAAPTDGESLHVAATVQLADGKTRVEDGQSAVYPLTLTARGGRWEITAIDRALRVNTGSVAPDLAPSPVPAPKTSTSPTK